MSPERTSIELESLLRSTSACSCSSPIGSQGSQRTSTKVQPDPYSYPTGHQSTAVSPAELYASLPLDRGSIRVFDLEDASRHADGRRQIRGRLRVVSLSESPTFTALSYVWGAHEPSRHTIRCNSCLLEVTANCWSALWHLWQMFGPMTIWVDSMCINQIDQEEKTAQIPLVGDLYSFAISVYIWLGEGNEQSDAAMDYLSSAGFREYFEEYRVANRSSPIPVNKCCWRIAWDIYLKPFRSFGSFRGMIFPHFLGMYV
jgi:hypothetical protein